MNVIDKFNPEIHSGPVPSPCVDVCKTNETTGLCEGCLRTTEEIASWSTADDDYKRAVWMELKRREAAMFDGPGDGSKP